MCFWVVLSWKFCKREHRCSVFEAQEHFEPATVCQTGCESKAESAERRPSTDLRTVADLSPQAHACAIARPLQLTDRPACTCRWPGLNIDPVVMATLPPRVAELLLAGSDGCWKHPSLAVCFVLRYLSHVCDTLMISSQIVIRSSSRFSFMYSVVHIAYV